MEPTMISLRDGRKMAYAEYGQPDGVPIVWLHGTPGAHLVASGVTDRARKYGVRLLAPVRPGFGLSDPKPGHSIVKWSDDLLELMDQLSLLKFGVLGASGGVPYALACAVQIPERLTTVSLASAIAPPTTEDMQTAPSRAEIEAERSAFVAQTIRDPEGLADGMIADMDPEEVAGIPDIREWLVASAREMFKQGGAGLYDEILMIRSQPWGFDLADVTMKVYLWHGTEDRLEETAHVLAEQLPQCVPTYFPGYGHMMPDSIFDKIFPAMLQEIKGGS